jgi:hypothetical protein
MRTHVIRRNERVMPAQWEPSHSTANSH